MGMSNYILETEEKKLEAITVNETASLMPNERFEAYFTDSYNGGTDEPLPLRGFGATKEAAIAELLSLEANHD